MTEPSDLTIESQSTSSSRGSAQSSPSAETQPQAEERLAFGGPVGAVAMMVLLPLLSVYLWLCIHRHGGALVLPTASVFAQIPGPTRTSVFWVAIWVVFQLALDLSLPGRAYTGLPQRDGR